MVHFLLPISWQYWYWKCLWAIISGAPALLIAARKNRSIWGWVLLCCGLGIFFGSPALLGLVLLSSRGKLNMRMKYLTLKFEEDLAHALKLPSPVGDNIEKRILMILANNPRGLRLGALAQGMGLDWRYIEEIVQRMLAQGKVKNEGERYFFNLD